MFDFDCFPVRHTVDRTSHVVRGLRPVVGYSFSGALVGGDSRADIAGSLEVGMFD